MGCACLKRSEIIKSKYIEKLENYHIIDDHEDNNYIINQSNRECCPKKIMEEFLNGNNKISEGSIIKIPNEDSKVIVNSSISKNESKTNCESPTYSNSMKKNLEQNKIDYLKNKNKKSGPIISMLEKQNAKNKNKIEI